MSEKRFKRGQEFVIAADGHPAIEVRALAERTVSLFDTVSKAELRLSPIQYQALQRFLSVEDIPEPWQVLLDLLTVVGKEDQRAAVEGSPRSREESAKHLAKLVLENLPALQNEVR